MQPKSGGREARAKAAELHTSNTQRPRKPASGHCKVDRLFMDMHLRREDADSVLQGSSQHDPLVPEDVVRAVVCEELVPRIERPHIVQCWPLQTISRFVLEHVQLVLVLQLCRGGYMLLLAAAGC